MNAHQPRRPAGIPAGGQFATKSQPAPGYDLDEDVATIDGRPVEPDITLMGSGLRIERYSRDGRSHDPDDGRPAVVSYGLEGAVKSERHYRDGQLHDPADGRPAALWYRPDGTVEFEGHYRDGQAHDPADGRPAVLWYLPDGTVEMEGHYRDGSRIG